MLIQVLTLLFAVHFAPLDEISDTVAEFKKFYKGNSTPAEKIEAIHVLDRLDHPLAVEALVDCFDDQDFSVRQTAIDVLGTYKSVECAQWLIDNIVKNKRISSKHVKVVALGALGEMGHEFAGEPISVLLLDRDPDILRAAAGALGKLKSTIAVPNLTKALKTNDPTVKIAVVDALGLIGDGSCAQEVTALLADDR